MFTLKHPTVWFLTCLISLLLFFTNNTLAYSPQTGPLFNDPSGNVEAQYRLLTHLDKSIDSVGKGGSIRIAVFSFDNEGTTDALIAAHKRGVNVQIVFNDHNIKPKIQRLQRALGTDHRKSSFAIVCHDGCRSSARPAAQHSKFYLFTKAGDSEKVVMIGSMNPTKMQAHTGWNDLYTVVNKAELYRKFVQIFDEMKRDRPVDNPYQTVREGVYDAAFFPRPGKTNATDNALELLKSIKCRSAGEGSGVDGRTSVKVMMFSWDKERALTIARKLWNLDNDGCVVSVVLASKGSTVLRDIVLKPTEYGGINVYNSRQDTNNDGVSDYYSHEKYVLINGHMGTTQSAKYVWTGSQNFTTKSLRNGDESMLGIMGDEAYKSYSDNYDTIINHSSNLHGGNNRLQIPELTLPRGVIENGEHLD